MVYNYILHRRLYHHLLLSMKINFIVVIIIATCSTTLYASKKNHDYNKMKMKFKQLKFIYNNNNNNNNTDRSSNTNNNYDQIKLEKSLEFIDFFNFSLPNLHQQMINTLSKQIYSDFELLLKLLPSSLLFIIIWIAAR